MAIEKKRIIAEIQRTARENGGSVLGWRRFEAETGIKYYDWFGQFWTRWNDAIREAGLEPNQMTRAFDEEYLVEKMVELTRRVARVPVRGDVLMASKNDEAFPSEKALRRLGRRADVAVRIIAFCRARTGYDDVASLWRQLEAASEPEPISGGDGDERQVGYVYLLRHGARKEYKIGRTYNTVRREGELGVQLPEKVLPIHYIETDDPAGVETYWHTRFAAKRKEGEWFALSTADVRAFQRWKRIY